MYISETCHSKNMSFVQLISVNWFWRIDLEEFSFNSIKQWEDGNETEEVAGSDNKKPKPIARSKKWEAETKRNEKQKPKPNPFILFLLILQSSVPPDGPFAPGQGVMVQLYSINCKGELKACAVMGFGPPDQEPLFNLISIRKNLHFMHTKGVKLCKESGGVEVQQREDEQSHVKRNGWIEIPVLSPPGGHHHVGVAGGHIHKVLGAGHSVEWIAHGDVVWYCCNLINNIELMITT